MGPPEAAGMGGSRSSDLPAPSEAPAAAPTAASHVHRRKFVYSGDEQLLLDVYEEKKQRSEYKHLIPKLRIHRKHHSGMLMRKTLTAGGV
eukprot:SAG11_NODE_1700_length_4412_cov_3.622803_1_plen_90_part_00